MTTDSTAPEPGTAPDDDVEGHRYRLSGETGADGPGAAALTDDGQDDDVEGHRRA